MRNAFRIAILWLAGIDLRLTLLAIPPVIPLIHRDLHLDESGIAALSNLPVLVLAGSSLFGALLTAKLGAKRALILGLWAIAISGALRGIGPSLPMLFGMTLIMGAGIAMIQPAFPALARAWYPERVPFATGIWANGLLCGEAFSAALTIPWILPMVGGSWELALAAWSAPVVVSALLLPFVHGATPRAAANAAWLPNLRDGRVWRLGIFQSSASLSYFGVNTFAPDYLHAVGAGAAVAAVLAALNVGQLPASLLVGLLPMRVLGRRGMLFGVAALMLIGLGCFVSAVGGAAIAGGVLVGLAGAYILTVSFALPAVVARHDEVARLAAGVFTVSYALSFIFNLVAGAIWDATRLPLAVAILIVASIGRGLSTMVAAGAPAA